MKIKSYITALFIIAVAPVALAATGVISGIVVDARNGSPVIGAEVVVQGTEGSAKSDLNGLFVINVEPGQYQIEIRHEGYQPELIAGVEVASGGDQNFGVVMNPQATAPPVPLEGNGASPTSASADHAQDEVEAPSSYTEVVTVTAEASNATEAAILLERKTSHDISDAIGRDEISRTSDSTSAGVMQRMTGVTLADDKFVYVRGLGERYSQTTMNGTTIPTTEPEKRVVPLDLFSANLLQKITVAKSYTPDRPGDFAAGMVEMETLDYPSSFTLSLSIGSGYDAGASGESVGTYGGGLSFFGNGGQSMPTDLPAERIARGGLLGNGFSLEELTDLSNRFVGTWEPAVHDAPLNQSYSLTIGNSWGRLGLVLSGSYNNSHDYTEEEQTYYSLGLDGALDQDHDYDFQISDQTVRQGVVANLALKASDNHQFKWRSFLTEVGSSEVRYFEGFNNDAGNLVQDNRLRYENETILTSQFSGDHYFQGGGPAGGLFDWKLAYSQGEREGNLREVLYERQGQTYVLADESQSGFLLFNDLNDEIAEATGNWSSLFFTERYSGSIKAGASFIGRERDFQSRRFRYVPQTGHNLDLTQSPEELFVLENFGRRGFLINEETRPTDSYTGTHDILGGYVMGDLTMGDWRFVGGARVENSEQDVTTFDLFDINKTPITTENYETDILPALNVTYQWRGNTNLRFAYSQTVNRPEFRELAPFEFTDVIGGRPVVGNPALERATIASYDLRWELFPTSGEVMAVSLFYKNIDQPIERVLEATAQIRTSFANAEQGENWGAELEFRRNLAFLGESLESLSVSANYTWVDSEVTIPAEGNILTTLNRPLAGQAENVINTALEYAPASWGSTFRLLYNYTGEKISDVGALGIPDVMEEARDTLDLVWMHDLGSWANGLRFKLSGENLLDEERLWTQGGLVQRRYTPGREFSLSFNYKVF